MYNYSAHHSDTSTRHCTLVLQHGTVKCIVTVRHDTVQCNDTVHHDTAISEK